MLTTGIDFLGLGVQISVQSCSSSVNGHGYCLVLFPKIQHPNNGTKNRK